MEILKKSVVKQAFLALRIAGHADISAVEDQLMGDFHPLILRHDPHQILLDFFRGGFLRKAHPLRQAQDVRIHDDAVGDPPERPKDAVGRFAPDARELDQLVHRVGDFAAVSFDQDPAALANVFRFVVVEARTVNVGLEFLLRGVRVIGRGPVFFEEVLRHDVHPDVGALGREDHRDEELQGRKMVQGAARVGIEDLQTFEDLLRVGRRAVLNILFHLLNLLKLLLN